MSGTQGLKPLEVDCGPESLVKDGPTVDVRISAPEQRADEYKVSAQIDTGSNSSVITTRLADKLGLPPVYQISQRRPLREAVLVDVFRCWIEFPCGTSFEANFAALSDTIDPHDVLIGRDILSICHLDVNFVTGKWFLTFNM